MKIYDMKKKVSEKQKKFVTILAYALSKKLNLEINESIEIINKIVDKKNESLFKNIIDNKYNKENLKDMNIEDIIKNSIKD